MSLIVAILIFLFAMSCVNVLLHDRQPVCNQLYKVAFFVTAFLFAIKYYYGADISFYVPMYDSLPTPWGILHGEVSKPMFEIGYAFFCSVLKWLGISYWGMTAVVTCVYFYAVYQLFKWIPSYKIVALFALVLLDYNLIFATFRQCMSVSLLILLVLAYSNKQYIKVLLYSVLMILMHKSGFVFALFILLLFAPLKFTQRYYWACLLAFVVFFIFPIQQLFVDILSYLPLNKKMQVSLAYHVLNTHKIQTVMIVYFGFLLMLCVYGIRLKEMKPIRTLLAFSSLLIVLFYEHHLVLWRLRSYFLPFAIVYVFYVCHYINHTDKVTILTRFKQISAKFPMQVMCVVFFLFSVAQMVSIYRLHKNSESRIFESSTVFQLLYRPKKEIVKDRMERAAYYWTNENKKYLK